MTSASSSSFSREHVVDDPISDNDMMMMVPSNHDMMSSTSSSSSSSPDSSITSTTPTSHQHRHHHHHDHSNNNNVTNTTTTTTMTSSNRRLSSASSALDLSSPVSGRRMASYDPIITTTTTTTTPSSAASAPEAPDSLHLTSASTMDGSSMMTPFDSSPTAPPGHHDDAESRTTTTSTTTPYQNNLQHILKFTSTYSIWFLKLFSCNFCIFITFCLVYGLLFWALAFRLVLQKKSHNYQEITHPLFLDFSKERPVYDVLVRQKWFLRHAHSKSNVRLGDIRLDFSIYKGWNNTRDHRRFNVDLHVLDRHAQVMWHSKRTVMLPPSIQSQKKRRKWRIPLLMSADSGEDETVSISANMLVSDDALELDAINRRISHAHIIRVSIDTQEVNIVNSQIQFIPQLSGYAYMTRHYFFFSLFLMSVGLFMAVSCCYGTTFMLVCCITARKKRTISTLREAPWSRSSFSKMWSFGRGKRVESTINDGERENLRLEGSTLGGSSDDESAVEMSVRRDDEELSLIEASPSVDESGHDIEEDVLSVDSLEEEVFLNGTDEPVNMEKGTPMTLRSRKQKKAE